MGNSIPENIIIGTIITTAEMSNAVNCLSARVEMSNPNERERIRYNKEIITIPEIPPIIGISSRYFANNKIVNKLKLDIRK